MTLHIDATNASSDFEAALKQLAQKTNVKLTIRRGQESKDPVLQALQEIENGEYESFKDFEEYQKAMNELRNQTRPLL